MKYIQLLVLWLFIVTTMLGCARNLAITKKDTKRSYTVMGKTYYPMSKVDPGYSETGLASWYGPGFHGKTTASNEKYNMYELTAAHNVLPLHTLVRVTNLNNKKEALVRINDRGPFVGDRLLDLSLGAAEQLGMVKNGVAPVRIAVITPGDSPYTSKGRATATITDSVRAPNPFYVTGQKGLLAFLNK
jgi:rare lipoprotein A